MESPFLIQSESDNTPPVVNEKLMKADWSMGSVMIYYNFLWNGVYAQQDTY